MRRTGPTGSADERRGPAGKGLRYLRRVLDDFLERFSLTARSETSAGASLPGVPTGLEAIAGCTFEAGLYRVHHADSAVPANEAVLAAFPTFVGRIACFGFDWLGRQFSVDPTRGPQHDPEVLMFEPGTGQALEIPSRFSVFHDAELVEFPDAALAASFFDEWLETPSATRPLAFDACVGYRVPLFVGGKDTVSNLELVNIDLYWAIMGQLRTGARSLPPGATIDSIQIT